MKAWKVLGALYNPKGITLYSYNPYLVKNTVFCSSPRFILISLKATIISNLLYILAAYSLANISYISRGAFRFLTVRLLSTR